MLSIVAIASAAVLTPGAKVLCVGQGPICLAAAKLSALRGFATTALMFPQELDTAKALVYDSKTTEGSIPLTFMPIAGENADEAAIEALASESEGLILAIDDQEKCFGAPVAETFIKPGTALKHVSLMSRNCNGQGMGFFCKSARLAANSDVWEGSGGQIKKFKEMEALITGLAKTAGADHTIVRAGTLKGGASGDQKGGAGEAAFLNPYFYSLGQQDVVNWRLLFDCDCLGVKLVKGDTLPGPGFGAALTATSMGDGDSHRGAVAAALVNSLGVDAAANADFSVGAEKGREFPKEDAWEAMFARA